ncbi:response regulator [Rhodopseudomonas sp. P1]|uniref:response regulator n=1 Tax=Rhodopseudomonas sp. P1 TaxID=3434357 RepID=UPI0031FC66BD
MKSRILHIDDDPAMLKVVAAVLSRDPDLETRGCLSAEEGVRAAAEWLPDLILSDVSMPDVDGVQFLEELRNQPITMSIPVVFTTACGRFDDISDFKSLGASGIIAKPFNLRELISSVRGYLELAAAAVDDEAPAPEIEIRDRFREDAALLRELREPFESGAAPDGLRHVAHKLVGVAGIYGFAAISAAAAEVERALKQVVQHASSRADVVSRLDDLLDLLDQNSGLRPD